MNKLQINIQGIYDLRTLKFLKSLGYKIFGFDFDPKSFNFIQEHVLLDFYKNVLSESDILFFSFRTSSDLMISKLIIDLKEINPSLDNIYFIFDEVESSISSFNYNFILKYRNKFNSDLLNLKNCSGLIIDFEILDDAKSLGKFETFCNNFMSKNPQIYTRNLKLILNTKWTDNLFSSAFEYLEFSDVQMNLSSEIEVCYRNVDQMKLKHELEIKRKYLQI